jgi:hypothetical protein
MHPISGCTVHILHQPQSAVTWAFSWQGLVFSLCSDSLGDTVLCDPLAIAFVPCLGASSSIYWPQIMTYTKFSAQNHLQEKEKIKNKRL